MEKPQLISGDGQHFSKVHIFKERDMLGEDKRDVKKNAHKSVRYRHFHCTGKRNCGADYLNEARYNTIVGLTQQSRERFGVQAHGAGDHWAYKHKAQHK